MWWTRRLRGERRPTQGRRWRGGASASTVVIARLPSASHRFATTGVGAGAFAQVRRIRLAPGAARRAVMFAQPLGEMCPL